MASIYEVEGPDGSIYEIEGPEGATAEQLAAVISSSGAKPRPTPTPTPAEPQPRGPGLFDRVRSLDDEQWMRGPAPSKASSAPSQADVRRVDNALAAAEDRRKYGKGSVLDIPAPDYQPSQADLIAMQRSPEAQLRDARATAESGRRAAEAVDKKYAKGPSLVERAATTVDKATGSKGAAQVTRDVLDTAMLLPEMGWTGAKIAADVANLATLGAADPLTKYLGHVIEGLNSEKSVRYQGKRNELAALVSNEDADLVDVVKFAAQNPRFMAELGVPSLPSMLVGAGGARALGVLNAAAAKRAGGTVDDILNAYRTGAVTGATGANVAMNAGGTFSETDSGLIDRLAAATVAGVGTKVAGRLTGGGAEAALATGARGAALRRAGEVGLRETGQEGIEGFSQAVGKGIGEGNLDLNKALKEGAIEAAAAGPLGVAAGLGAKGPKQPAPEIRTAPFFDQANVAPAADGGILPTETTMYTADGTMIQAGPDIARAKLAVDLQATKVENQPTTPMTAEEVASRAAARPIDPEAILAQPEAVPEQPKVNVSDAGSVLATLGLGGAQSANGQAAPSPLPDAAPQGGGVEVAEIGRRLEEARARLTASPSGEDRALAAEFPRNLRPVADPAVRSQIDAISQAAAEVFGTPPIIAAEMDDGPDGFDFDGRQVLNASRMTKPAPFIAWHEATHHLQRLAESGDAEARQIWTPVFDSVYGMIPEADRQSYASKFLFRDRMGRMNEERAARGQQPMTIDELLRNKRLSAELKREMVADFAGKRALDRDFIDGLAKRDPKSFGKFARKWVGILNSLIDKLRGRKALGASDVDKTIADLQKAKALWADAMIAWQKRGGQHAKPEPTAYSASAAQPEAAQPAREAQPAGDGAEGGEPALAAMDPEVEGYLAKAMGLVEQWRAKLGGDIEIVMGGSLVSGTFVQTGDDPIDMDVRFLTKNPEADFKKVEEVTGLKLVKQIQVNDFPLGTSTAYMVEGFIDVDGLNIEVEGAVRTPAYVGWANFYRSVFTEKELADFRDGKRRLKNGDKKAYKTFKNTMLAEGQARAIARGLVPQRDYDTPESWKMAPNGKALIDDKGNERGLGLNSTERFVEQQFYDLLNEDMGKQVGRYLDRFKNIVDADLAKEISPVYALNKEFANAVHEPSSALSKAAWAEALSRDKRENVIFTAGGAGSGKSHSGELVRKKLSLAGDTLTFDSAFTSMGPTARIDAAVADGRKVTIIYTNTAAPMAFGWSLKRERLMRANVVASSHQRAADTIRELQKRYADNPSVSIKVVNNLGNEVVRSGEVVDVPVYEYNQLERELYEIAGRERDAGRLEERKYQFVVREILARGLAPEAGGDGQEREVPGVDRAGEGQDALRVQQGEPPPDGGLGEGGGEESGLTPGKAEPLYISRPVVNGQQILDWARSVGITGLVPLEKLHVTQVYSRAPVDYSSLPAAPDSINAYGVRLGRLGDDGDIVLHLKSASLQKRFDEAAAAGASYDYDSYKPHITLSYKGKPGVDDQADLDLGAIRVPVISVKLGAEEPAPLQEGWPDSVEPSFSRAQGKTDETDETDDGAMGESREQPDFPETLDQAAALSSAMKTARGKSWRKGRDLKSALQAGVLKAAKAAGVNPRVRSPQAIAYLTRVGVKDAVDALKANANAIGWYDLKTRQALSVVSLIHPEIATDEDARLAFVWALAVTSNGLKVDKNFELAERAYRHYKRNGEMPTNLTAGQAQKAINESLGLFDTLRKEWGADNLRRFMLSNFTVGEIGGINPDLKPGGEHVDVVVKGSSILGPKIGNGFFANLYGSFDALTMDRWLVRTWGRWTGTLISKQRENTAVARDRLRDAIKAVAASPADQVRLSKVLGKMIGANAETDALAPLIAKASMDPEDRAEMNRTPAGVELRLAGNGLAKYLDGQKEAPSGPHERKYIREVFGRILDELRQRDGYAELTMADLQAVLWYAEKRLYEAAKTEDQDSKTDGYEDDDAPDYANAAAATARARGVSDAKIKAALAAEEGKSGRPADARLPAEQGAAEGQGDAGQGRGFTEGARGEFLESQREARTLREERDKPKRARIVFEVAPDPNNEPLSNAWRSLDDGKRFEISKRLARSIATKVLDSVDNGGIFLNQVGSYLEDTNPSFALMLTRSGDAVDAAKLLGYVLAQDSMMVVSPKPVKGANETGAIVIDVGDKSAAELDAIYRKLRAIRVGDEQPIGGQSTVNGQMVVLNFSGVETDKLARLADKALGGKYTVGKTTVYAAFPDKQEYDYASAANDPRGNRGLVRQRARDLRAEAQQALEAELRGAGISFSRAVGDDAGGRDAGGADAGGQGQRLDQGLTYGAPAPGAAAPVEAVHFSNGTRQSLNSGFYGHGLRGAEAERLAQSADPRIRQRIYFYVNQGTGIRPEAGVGAFAHKVTLANLYDASEGRITGTDMNAFESAVIDAGYDGYLARLPGEQSGQAVLLGRHDVQVEPQGVGPTQAAAIAPAAARAAASRMEGDELVSQSPPDSAAIRGAPKVREAAPSFRLQFGKFRVLPVEAGFANAALSSLGSSVSFSRGDLAADLEAQQVFLQERARAAGFETIDEFVEKDYDGFVAAAEKWREDNPEEMLQSRRALGAWRDSLGRFQFAPTAAMYRLIAPLVNAAATRVGMNQMPAALKRQVRAMNASIEGAQDVSTMVAKEAFKMTEADRELVSDIVENELQAGTVPPAHAVRMASGIQTIMDQQTNELVRLGMLSKETADRHRGTYLPRFYQSKLRQAITDPWAAAVAKMTARPSAMVGIQGKRLKGRGLWETVPASELQDWTDLGWEVRDPSYVPGVSKEVQVWRDFTREEREKMGEIRDAGFRFVMGFMQTQRDIALGRLFEGIASNSEISSKNEKPGWVQVPDGSLPGTGVKRYGKLAGMWVPEEVMNHLANMNDGHGEMMRMYRKALSAWKEGKTVLNPVAHANNVMSNVTMAHLAGVSYWDAHKYAGAIMDLAKNRAVVQEAKAAGLFQGTISQAEFLQSMPPELRAIASIQESKTEQAAGKVWDMLSLWLRKPMGKAYESEDLFFRYLIYRDARGRGLSPEDAVDYAQRYIFTYDDLPQNARRIRDYGIPFFAYTYKVMPALAHTAAHYPHRMAAPAAAFTGLSMLAYALLSGEDGEDWIERLQKYVTDPERQKKAAAQREEEYKNLPSWMKGYTSLMTPKAIRLWTDDVTGLPMFLDTSRIIPGGDIFDAAPNNSGGLSWLQPLTPNHPLLSTFGAMFLNRDSFLGKDVVEKTDTTGEAAAKRAAWLYRQYAPAIAYGNYHSERIANAIAQALGEPVRWVPWSDSDATGFGRDGLPVQPKLAALQTVGVKARPIDLELSAKIEQSTTKAMLRDLDAEMRRLRRLSAKNAISERQLDIQTERVQLKKQRLRAGLTVDGEERE